MNEPVDDFDVIPPPKHELTWTTRECKSHEGCCQWWARGAYLNWRIYLTSSGRFVAYCDFASGCLANEFETLKQAKQAVEAIENRAFDAMLSEARAVFGASDEKE